VVARSENGAMGYTQGPVATTLGIPKRPFIGNLIDN